MDKNIIVFAFLLLAFAFLFIWTTSLMGQSSTKEYVQKNTYNINSIDPNNEDYSDLEVIGNAIGNSQVVMLGEQDHGDAPTFQAKARIIKYLHEEKGFNVIAFESDFYALNQGWKQVLKNKMSSDSLMTDNIFPIWTKCKECEDVFSYINSTQTLKNRIHITGFDIQLHGLYSQYEFKSELIDYLTFKEIVFLKTPEYNNQFLPIIDSLLYHSRRQTFIHDEKVVQQLINNLDIISSQITVENERDEFWRKTLESTRIQIQAMIYRKRMLLSRRYFPQASKLRDENMAKNLHWLATNTYKNEKIIVWAANAHINKYNFDGKNDSFIKSYVSTPMGYYYTKIKGNLAKTYILGFTSYKGIAGRVYTKTKYAVETPKKDGLEEWIGQLKYAFSFTNMQPNRKIEHFKDKSFFAKLYGHSNLKAEWAKGFDGIFFIDTMYPCQVK